MGDVSLRGLFVLDPLVHLVSVYGDILGCSNTDPELIASLAQNGDLDIVTNVDGLSWSPG